MPRKPTAKVFISLSPNALAAAVDVHPRVISKAIFEGKLGPVYQQGAARRILISDAEKWIRDHWAKNKARKSRKSKPAGKLGTLQAKEVGQSNPWSDHWAGTPEQKIAEQTRILRTSGRAIANVLAKSAGYSVLGYKLKRRP